MKTIQVSPDMSVLRELLELAGEENVLLQTPEGREFVLAEVDDFDREVELVRQNEELMDFLAARSQEKSRFTLQEVREKLNLP
jgi:hypothetical protein